MYGSNRVNRNYLHGKFIWKHQTFPKPMPYDGVFQNKKISSRASSFTLLRMGDLPTSALIHDLRMVALPEDTVTSIILIFGVESKLVADFIENQFCNLLHASSDPSTSVGRKSSA